MADSGSFLVGTSFLDGFFASADEPFCFLSSIIWTSLGCSSSITKSGSLFKQVGQEATCMAKVEGLLVRMGLPRSQTEMNLYSSSGKGL